MKLIHSLEYVLNMEIDFNNFDYDTDYIDDYFTIPLPKEFKLLELDSIAYKLYIDNVDVYKYYDSEYFYTYYKQWDFLRYYNHYFIRYMEANKLNKISKLRLDFYY